jgi:GR25 family glycosyltransferase involved in LPS biosynthesis
MAQALWYELFDRIVVISLAQSAERRAYIEDHLPSIGITEFDIFTATGADDLAVKEAYAQGRVFKFPPCFRCGLLDCGNDDCNNVLLPPQVATFITYLGLWNEIASRVEERILILEDDVVIHSRWSYVLRWLLEEINSGNIEYSGNVDRLLRFGWAASHEHSDIAPRISSDVRMSNPCHAITRGMAKRLLERFTSFSHTVDVFQHQKAPLQGEAFTVMPPIAAEHSWSSGALASTIHPKAIHLDWLSAQGLDSERDKYEAVVRHHVKKKYFRKVLISGHPRCGTGYAAALCRQLGLDIGQESDGVDGLSSWMFAVDAVENPYAADKLSRSRRALAWDHFIVPVRNLVDASASVIRENQYAPQSYEFRRSHILSARGIDLDYFSSALEQAVWSLTSWMRMLMDQSPDLVFRIEDQADDLKQYLIHESIIPSSLNSITLDKSKVNSDKPYKGLVYPKPAVDADSLRSFCQTTLNEIEWYCRTFGYYSII